MAEKTTAFTGPVVVGLNDKKGEIRLTDGKNVNEAKYLSIAAPSTITSDTTLTFPNGAGNPGQILSTDGSGNLSWVNDSAGNPAGTNGQVQTNDGGVFGAISEGSSGQVLTSNGAGVAPTFQAAPTGGIAAVVDDTTPELGGTLNLNGQGINGSGTINVSGGSLILRSNFPNGSNNGPVIGSNTANGLSGFGSMALGTNAGRDFGNCTGNIAVGTGSMLRTTTGGNNVAVGREAMRQNTTSGSNTAVGFHALDNTTGGSNTAVGSSAGSTLTSGQNNIFIGAQAEPSSATASDEITFGNNSITSLRIPGLQSGASSGDVLTYNGTDITLAAAAGGIDTSGSAWSTSGDTVFLQSTGQNNPTNYSNSIVLNSGSVKLDGNHPTGINNVALGNAAGGGLSSGALANTLIGNIAGQNVSTGDNNTVVGSQALRQTNLNSNTAVGSQALELNNQSENTAVGHLAMSGAAGGQGCVGVGHRALAANSANFNTGVGKDALRSNVSGLENCALGTNAGGNLGSGNSNVFIGRSCGSSLTSGQNNILIGRNAQPSTDPISNEITLGDSNITTLRCQVTTITSLSDARDKKDVEDANIGLDFINDLRPVKFVWDTRDGAKKDIKEVGFIAQELDEVQQKHGVEDHLQLVLKNNPDKLEASPGKLIPILVQAIKDLKKELDELKKA